MRKTLNKIFLAAGIAIAAVGVARADNDMNNMGSDSTMLTPQQFVWEAAIAGRKEVRLSEIALEKTDDADVKKFAKRMITDHSKANASLMKIADEEGLAFPATNTFSMEDTNWNNVTNGTTPSSYTIAVQNIKEGQLLTTNQEPFMTNMDYSVPYLTIQHLQSLSGVQFDQAYANVMVKDHVKAVNLFESASQHLSDAKLKKFAAKTLPTLQKHSKMAQELADNHGGVMMQEKLEHE